MELSGIYKDSGKKGLMELPHIGEGISKKIVELFETGKLKYLEELRSKLPEGLINLLEVPGMGPKTAMALSKKFNIKTVAELENFLEDGRIRGLKGFGEKTEVKLLKGIDIYKKGISRKIMGEMHPVAIKIIEKLNALPCVKKAVAAGSMRRMEETVGDIDILAVSSNPKKAMDLFCSMDMVKDVIVKGEKKSSIFTEYDIQADLRVVDEDSYGAALQYFTGNKEHNVRVREIAVKKGYKLNEYGLFSANGKKLIKCADEKMIYNKLGMQYIPPELRTGSDEIKAALENKIPVLVEMKDIRGDLHCHTKDSDGANSLEEMAEAAQKLGYAYMAVTNHSQSLTVARGLKPDKVKLLAEKVKALNKKEKGEFTVLMGGEVDILADGSLDYPDDILREMDIVIGSVHGHFNMDKDKMTARIMKAMENKYLGIIGHISGRLINSREPYDLDYTALFQKAAATKTAVEINCQPDRLDLKDIYVRQAVEMGVKLAIDTDSHADDQLGLMLYGVGTARRGWATKNDIINAWGLKKVRLWLDEKRK